MEHRSGIRGGTLLACTASGSSRGRESAGRILRVWTVARDGTEDAAVRSAARLPATATASGRVAANEGHPQNARPRLRTRRGVAGPLPLCSSSRPVIPLQLRHRLPDYFHSAALAWFYSALDISTLFAELLLPPTARGFPNNGRLAGMGLVLTRYGIGNRL